MKNPDFNRRLAELIGNKEPFRWAKEMGIPGGTFSRIWKEGTVPKSELLTRISKHTDVSLNWLLLGAGPMLMSDVETTTGDAIEIPRYDVHLSAGDGHLNDHKARLLDYIPFTREFLQKKLNRSSIKDLSILEATGDSMLPTISDGDLVLIDESDKSEIDGIFAYVQGDFARIKRLRFMMGGKIEIVSDNEIYASETVTGSDLAIAGL